MTKKYEVMSQAFSGGNKKSWYFDTLEEARQYAIKKYKFAVIKWRENDRLQLLFTRREG